MANDRTPLVILNISAHTIGGLYDFILISIDGTHWMNETKGWGWITCRPGVITNSRTRHWETITKNPLNLGDDWSVQIR